MTTHEQESDFNQELECQEASPEGEGTPDRRNVEDVPAQPWPVEEEANRDGSDRDTDGKDQRKEGAVAHQLQGNEEECKSCGDEMATTECEICMKQVGTTCFGPQGICQGCWENLEEGKAWTMNKVEIAWGEEEDTHNLGASEITNSQAAPTAITDTDTSPERNGDVIMSDRGPQSHEDCPVCGSFWRNPVRYVMTTREVKRGQSTAKVVSHQGRTTSSRTLG